MVRIDIDSLLSTMLLKIVSLFVWRQGDRVAGWATYSDQSMLRANLPDQGGIAGCRMWLRTELGFSELSDVRLIDGTIRTYCRFLQRAHGHRLGGRIDEAFIHFIFALDLLLGSEGRLSDSVAIRAATLVYRQLRREPAEQTQRLKRLYGLRSRYVHQGQGISASDLCEVEMICTEVLWALLYVSGQGGISDIDEWLRKLDFITASMNVGHVLPEDELCAVGIPREGHVRKSPLRVLESQASPLLPSS
jgi:hypothetical protein